MSKSRGAPPKPPELRKAKVVQIRLSEADKALCTDAAALADQTMARWARETLVRTAKRQTKSKEK